MNKKIAAALAVLVIALCAGAAFAQTSAQTVVANVPFEFYVGNTQLPAGQYEVYPEGAAGLSVVVRNMRTGQAVFAPIGYRTGSVETTKAELVFDRDKDKSYLAIVRPFEADSYTVSGAPANHSHVVVKSS